MGDRHRTPSPDFVFDDESGGKPLVDDYGPSNKYRPGQKVNLRVPGQTELEGPYKIETHAGVRKYTLCSLDGKQFVRNRAAIDEEDLTPA